MEISHRDKKIIKDSIKGRQDAWTEFVQKFSGIVIWSIKERLTKVGCFFSNDDVEDIHQEVFLCLYNGKLKQLKDISKIASWLSIISGNNAITYMRKKGLVAKKSVSLFEEIQSGENDNLTILDTLEADEPSIAEQIDKKLQQDALAKVIESLNPKEKLIMNLHFTYGNTIKEIAENIGLAQGTVASIIARTKDKVKKKIGDRFL